MKPEKQSMDTMVSFLQTVDIFSTLSKDEIGSLVGVLAPVSKKKGEALFSQGDSGEELFIVKTGRVTSTIELPDGKERVVAEFGSGDFFGEMAIFENAPRSATCRAGEDSTLCRLHQNDFFSFIKSDPRIAIKIMYRMLHITTQRLQNTGGFLSEMIRWGNDARRRAITDELTGIYNRRYLDEALEEHYLGARARAGVFSLGMVDLDHFREINECYGHETGDRLILEVVEVFKKHLRPADIVARYGGDEFSVIFPDTPPAEAWKIAEAVRVEVEKLSLLEGLGGPMKRVTTSQGIASYPSDADSVKGLREKADQSLYRAKEEGRNRVVRAS
ncbi:MAG TPA: GGDEF domain-containing protein [Spirochaetes bacterium]|nr:GGDEF domain-containing protein [Spirochaetota bacterium]